MKLYICNYIYKFKKEGAELSGWTFTPTGNLKSNQPRLTFYIHLQQSGKIIKINHPFSYNSTPFISGIISPLPLLKWR